MFTLLGAAAVAWTVITGLVRLDLLGNAVEVRLTECHQEGGGRAGSHSVCSGLQVGDETRTVKIRYEGHSGEVIRAAQKPWGSYEPVETGFVAWGIWVLTPVVCLMVTAAAGVLTGREMRRVRRRHSGHDRASGARSGHGDDDDDSSGAVAPV
ncbi:hypothetical protein [Streptomyces sp. NPDC087437]|uniref:hypothetical protein n=1 Tax=Streptomyces sp. NPDC087437 TaxID=3365789 RepID=UPI00381820E2